jgi:hypothetical protein
MDTGPGWTRFEGAGTDQMTISSNKAVGFNDIAHAYAYVSDSGESDVTITLSATFNVQSGANYAQIVFRYQDASNFWTLRVNGATSNNVELLKTISGSETVVDTDSLTIATGSPITLKVVASGTSIIATTDGSVIQSTTDAALETETKHGIRTYQNGVLAVNIDDFLVTTP